MTDDGVIIRSREIWYDQRPANLAITQYEQSNLVDAMVMRHNCVAKAVGFKRSMVGLESAMVCVGSAV